MIGVTLRGERVVCGGSRFEGGLMKSAARLLSATKVAERTGAEAVKLSGVSIDFNVAGKSVFRAVENAELRIGAGEFVAIVGPTGCGKTTLLNAAAGLITPTSGLVSIFGTPLAGLNQRAGYLFQQDALMPWKKALDNIAIGLEISGTARKVAREEAHAWLQRVGLGAFSDRYPHMLSGGQRKRVAMAQVLIRNPDILLMDEPFGPLDAQTRLVMGQGNRVWDLA